MHAMHAPASQRQAAGPASSSGRAAQAGGAAAWRQRRPGRAVVRPCRAEASPRPEPHRAAAAAGADAAAQAFLQAGRELAAARAHESQQAAPLLIDPYAQALSAGAAAPPASPTGLQAEAQRARDVIATKFIDECLLNAINATSVNSITRGGDYRQVVLLGDGLDSRPFRLPWPPGTVIYCLAPLAAHEAALASLKAAQAAGTGGARGGRPPEGTLLRRISADLSQGDDGWPARLQAAGFRGDRLSVWALQGLPPLAAGTVPSGSGQAAGAGAGGDGAAMSVDALTSVLVEVANLACFASLVAGELPAMPRPQAEALLAGAGLLGATYGLGEGATAQYGRWRPEYDAAGGEGAGGRAHWLFSGQQRQLSLAQMETYAAHREEAEGLDEDFTDNFS